MNRVYFAFRSPYSRLGLHVIRRSGLSVQLIPFTGPPDGVAFMDPLSSAPKLLYYAQDVPRMTLKFGLPLTMPKPFDVDFASANRAAVAAERDGFGLAFVIEVSDARWGRGLDVSDPEVVSACANACGWNAQAARDAQGDTTIDDTLAQHRSLIIQDGVFGVPFAVLERTNGTESFWGHDRFELFAESARGS